MGISLATISGVTGELRVAIELLSRGYVVSQPIVPCQYDYVTETMDGFFKIQVKSTKTGRVHIGRGTGRIKGSLRGYSEDAFDVLVVVDSKNFYVLSREVLGDSKSLNTRDLDSFCENWSVLPPPITKQVPAESVPEQVVIPFKNL